MYLSLPKKILYGLLVAILLLLILNTWSYLYVYYGKLEVTDFFFDYFSFNEEKNAPAIFSSLLHLFASILLASVARSHLKIKSRKWFWWILSGVFLFLGFDELLRIHENIRGNSSSLIEASGTFLYNWVIFYGSAVILLGIIIIKPLFQLPKKTLYKFLFAGFIFLFGAIGLENIVGGYVWHQELNQSMVIRLPVLFVLSTLEELFEMLGVSFFIYAILEFKNLYAIPQTT